MEWLKLVGTSGEPPVSVSHDHVQSDFEYLHKLCGQPVATLGHSCTEYFLFLCFLCFSLFLLPLVLSLSTTEKNSGSIFYSSLYPVHCFMHNTVIPWSLLFSRPNSPSSHNYSYARCSSPLNISIALHWTHLSYIHISCTGKPRANKLHFLGSQRILILHLYVQKIRTFHSGKQFATSVCLFFNSFTGGELEVFPKNT